MVILWAAVHFYRTTLLLCNGTHCKVKYVLKVSITKQDITYFVLAIASILLNGLNSNFQNLLNFVVHYMYI